MENLNNNIINFQLLANTPKEYIELFKGTPIYNLLIERKQVAKRTCEWNIHEADASEIIKLINKKLRFHLLIN